MMRPYEELSRHYDVDWGTWGLQYADLAAWVTKTYDYPIRKVVDVGCGVGALAAELFRRGYWVLGIDLSPEMIDRARSLCPDAEFVVGDMASVPVRPNAELAICSYDSLNYLTTEDKLTAALRNIRKMLRPCAFFLFDINTPLLYEERHHGTIERNSSGAKFCQVLTYDEQKRLATTVFDFGSGRVEKHTQRAYGVEEMKRYLQSTGFEALATYENFDLTESGDASLKVIFLARTQSEVVHRC
jgi:SAM-dependent methyltransferase